ncbi:MAG: hypothetical protein ACK5C5_09360 [Bacteroidota bacterium]
MRLPLLVFFFLGMISKANAQTYHPILDSVSNVWHYTGNWIPVRTDQTVATTCDYQWITQYSRLETVGDTVINGFDYTIVDNLELWTGFVPCRFGYLREDTVSREVYFMPNDFSNELLMYDFSLNQGDIVQLDFTPFSGIHPAGQYFVDTIFTISTTAGPRSLFELRSVSFPFSDPVQWIEGVGSPGGLAYLKTSSGFGGLFMNTGCSDGVYRGDSQLLVCLEKAGVRTYFDSCAHAMASNSFCFFYGDSCFFYNICGSLEDLGVLSQVTVNPNPFMDVFQVELESSRDILVYASIYDLNGRQIQEPTSLSIRSGKNVFPMELNIDGSGVFLLRISSDVGELIRTLIFRLEP